MAAHATPQTINPADIGPDNLWAVWHRVDELFQHYGYEPVEVKWMLAASGPEGFDNIQKEFPNSLLTAMPLSLLHHLNATLPPETVNVMPKWVQVALGTDNNFILVRAPDGSTRVVHRTQDIKPHEIELVKGSRADFEAILNDGNRILSAKDWKSILGDVRSFVTKGEVGWLDYQQDPKGAAAAAQILKRVRDGE